MFQVLFNKRLGKGQPGYRITRQHDHCTAQELQRLVQILIHQAKRAERSERESVAAVEGYRLFKRRPRCVMVF